MSPILTKHVGKPVELLKHKVQKKTLMKKLNLNLFQISTLTLLTLQRLI